MTCLKNIPSVDHAFCGRLYLCDFKRGSLLSMEVVQTFNRTSLSDITSYRVLSSETPQKFQAKRKKYHVSTLPKCQAYIVCADAILKNRPVC